MRIKTSYLIAAGIALAISGWLASGQLDAGKTERDPAAAAARSDSARLPTVRVRELVAEPVELVIVVNGKTAPARAVAIRAETDGRIVELGAERGDSVEAGGLLVRIDARERTAMVEQAEATLRMREIEYDAARQLGAKGFQSETKVAEAEANLEAAQAALKQAGIRLDHTEIRAPFAGVLETRPVELGDFVDVGDEVATVIDQDPFLVTGQVSEAKVGYLAVGMTGSATLVSGPTVEGRLRYIGSRADPATRTFTVELEVPNESGRFAAGVSAELRIVYDQALAHRVPASMLALSDEGVVGIKTVDGDNQVVFHPTEIIRADGDSLWVAGLPEQVRAITVGQGFVRAGDEVRPVADQAVEPQRPGAERPA
ncbi:MAG TPA: efflux RND transporter periplasmic adaptor subunit [Geminicoccaceae bacterium]|nr:efflux RND transporter periplasmic adaptor subunit [Geminicoccaceae bacterium]